MNGLVAGKDKKIWQSTHLISLVLLLSTLFNAGFPPWSLALKPDQVLVIANSGAPGSVDLACYYMEKRDIPKTNLLKIKIANKERCRRSEYRKLILNPLRRYLVLAGNSDNLRCLVLVYGVPLVIKPDSLDRTKRRQVKEKRERLRALKVSLEKARNSVKDKKIIEDLRKKIRKIKREIQKISETDQVASVDSELSLARFDRYKLSMWLPNPYFVGYRGSVSKLDAFRERVFMVSRIDAPDYRTAKRIIDDSITVEKTGLRGIAYFDARYPKVGKSPSMYGKYDLSIRKAAELVHKSGAMKVVLDLTPELFRPGSCKHAALYCGWYSLAHYVDAFSWVRGSVGYHIASSECVSLHEKAASYWCIKMLQKGVAATLGPVAEPYLRAFPPPDLFFKFLLEGKPLVEAYFLSKPFVSWRMVLVGDPLYRPFVNHPAFRGHN